MLQPQCLHHIKNCPSRMASVRHDRKSLHQNDLKDLIFLIVPTRRLLARGVMAGERANSSASPIRIHIG